MILLESLFGKKKTIQQKHEVGTTWENTTDKMHWAAGDEFRRIKTPADRIVTQSRPIVTSNGKIKTEKRTYYEEDKSSSTAPLRPSQEEAKRKYRDRYRVNRPF